MVSPPSKTLAVKAITSMMSTLINGTLGRIDRIEMACIGNAQQSNSYTTRECTRMLFQLQRIDRKHEAVLSKTCSAS